MGNYFDVNFNSATPKEITSSFSLIMAFLHDIKELVRPYYLVNCILSISFLVLKTVSPMCMYLFPVGESQCELDMKQSEIMFFLLFVIVMRARKTGSVTMLAYLSTGFMYCKVASLILWFNADPRYGLVFLVLFVLQAILFPEPSYTGPEKVVYFNATSLEEELNRNKKVVWIVTFYTVWSPSCVNFASTFSKLSAEYTLDNLKFGKVDVGRFPELAKKYYINDTSFSRQLPTIIVFKNGEEYDRRPAIDSKGQLQKFIFNEDNVKVQLDFNNIYNDCKKNPIKEKKEKRVKSE
uniref:Thioredoxin-related transmembrane protein 2-B n=2 Tax=Daphnia magna TaxID=35525 RepID=A0A0P6CXC2_9CRUS